MINKVKLGLNNLYLFENNNGDYLLLDTGLACKEDLILNKINKVIGDYNKIKVIVITHSHSDHIGNLKLNLDFSMIIFYLLELNNIKEVLEIQKILI